MIDFQKIDDETKEALSLFSESELETMFLAVRLETKLPFGVFLKDDAGIYLPACEKKRLAIGVLNQKLKNEDQTILWEESTFFNDGTIQHWKNS